MEWIIIFQAVVEMIQSCQSQRRPLEGIKNEIRNPGPFQRLVVVRRLRQKLRCSRSEAVDHLDKALAEARFASDQEIDDLIAEALQGTGEVER